MGNGKLNFSSKKAEKQLQGLVIKKDKATTGISFDELRFVIIMNYKKPQLQGLAIKKIKLITIDIQIINLVSFRRLQREDKRSNSLIR
jgi:hypothetical protein